MHLADEGRSEAGGDSLSSERLVAAFRDSMPEAYRLRYEGEDVRRHARIVQRRGAALVHVESCTEKWGDGDEPHWICVVTDDRPGLLSLLSAAISAHSLDILGARIYSRRRNGRPDEAVDFFAVRRINGMDDPEFVASDLVAIRGSIESLLRGELDEAWLARRAAKTQRPAAPQVRVRFDDTAEGEVLTVDAEDRPGLLLTLTLALHRSRARIVQSNVTTVRGRAHDAFVISELDGRPLVPSRKEEIVAAIEAALSSKR